MPPVSFYIPCKQQKAKYFLMFSGTAERPQYSEMGKAILNLFFRFHFLARLPLKYAK